jgi:hypothetical protein
VALLKAKSGAGFPTKPDDARLPAANTLNRTANNPFLILIIASLSSSDPILARVFGTFRALLAQTPTGIC